MLLLLLLCNPLTLAYWFTLQFLDTQTFANFPVALNMDKILAACATQYRLNIAESQITSVVVIDSDLTQLACLNNTVVRTKSNIPTKAFTNSISPRRRLHSNTTLQNGSAFTPKEIWFGSCRTQTATTSVWLVTTSTPKWISLKSLIARAATNALPHC